MCESFKAYGRNLIVQPHFNSISTIVLINMDVYFSLLHFANELKPLYLSSLSVFSINTFFFFLRAFSEDIYLLFINLYLFTIN